MEAFDLSSEPMLEVLIAKGITNFFHANTVLTSYTFLEHSNLLSRKFIEDNELRQTPQYTDDIDKKYNIYNDIFMDTVDIHERARRRNNYGPILFVFPLNILSTLKISFVRFTKKNPSKWNDDDLPTDRYFHSVEEFKNGYSKGNFDTMMIIPNRDKLPLLNTLDQVIFDKPEMHWKDNGKNLTDEAVEYLKAAAVNGGLSNKGIGIRFRKCDARICNCFNQYIAINNHGKIIEIFRYVP
ncbi:MAG TPA: hypothetical protein VL443_28000 [Cyclobacteriaceae bacterium]|jgi:hypothetical protein|nr:hypothetical protein [Cyclobacteriaceae bacterium]